MPLVIVEGPDGSGKTTLANRLLKMTGHPTVLVRRSGRPGNHETLELQSRWIRAQASIWGLNVLCDRHPLISDAIYSIAVRKETPAWEMKQIAELLSESPILLIYCRTITSRMEKNAHVEEQMEGVHSHYLALVKEYDEWFAEFRARGVRVEQYDNLLDGSGGAIGRLVREFWEKSHG